LGGGETEIVEIIDDNFVMIHHHQLNLIFSRKDQMFNAAYLVKTISDSEIFTWKRSKPGK
jgi:ribosomal protein L14E/L6E/L27E